MKERKKIVMLISILCLNASLAFSKSNGLIITPDSVLAQRNVTLGELLRGRVPGLQVLSTDGAPGGSFDMIIRGGATIRNGVLPLIYLDGIALNGSSHDVLNPWSKIDSKDYQAVQSLLSGIYSQDIEAIEILSDIAQTAKYGSDGANGVILIRTKKGKSGQNTVDFNSNEGLSINHQNSFFTNGVVHNQNITVQGNQRRTNYYISAVLSQQDGVLHNSGTNDVGLNVHLEQLINERSRLGIQILFSNSKISMIQATSMLGGTSLVTQLNNPIGSYDSAKGWMTDYDDNINQWRMAPQLSYSYRILGGLSFNVSGGMDYVGKTRFRWMGNAIERGLATNSRAGESQSYAIRYTVNPELKYKLYFSKKHELNLSLNGTAIGNDETLIANCGTNFTVPSLRAKGIGFASQFFNVNYLHNSSETNKLGFYADYQYDNRFNAEGGIIGTQMTKYDQGNINYYPYLNFSAKVYAPGNSGAINNISVNAGWGISGLNKIGDYTQIENLLSEANDSYNLPSNALLYYYPLLNTKNRELNIGADFKLFDNKLNVKLNYYNSRITEKLFIQSYQPDTVKIVYRPATQDTITTLVSIDDSHFVNSMMMKRQGLELAISDVIFKNTISDLMIAGNLTWCGNKIDGHSSTLFYGYDNENSTNETIIGSANPDFIFGCQIAFRFKAFAFFSNFDGIAGNQILNMNGYQEGRILKDRVENGSFLRWSSLAINYNFPVDKLKLIKALALHFTASNLFTITKYTGYSPDVNSFVGQWNQRGVDYGAYPAFRTFTVGCSAKF